MFVYGGAWQAGARWEYEFVGRAFAAAGYVAVLPDYRLFPEVVYPDFLEDIAQSMKWVEDNIAQLWRRQEPLLHRRALGGRVQFGDGGAR
jgi:acetyl esterase/lipase